MNYDQHPVEYACELVRDVFSWPYVSIAMIWNTDLCNTAFNARTVAVFMLPLPPVVIHIVVGV